MCWNVYTNGRSNKESSAGPNLKMPCHGIAYLTVQTERGDTNILSRPEGANLASEGGLLKW